MLLLFGVLVVRFSSVRVCVRVCVCVGVCEWETLHGAVVSEQSVRCRVFSAVVFSLT